MSGQSLSLPADARIPDGMNLMEILTALGRERKVFLGIPAVLCTLTAIYGLVATPVFSAKTVVMPPPQQQQSPATAMLEQLGPLAGMAGASVGMKNTTDLYEALLKSSSVQRMLVERFRLQERYKTKTLTDTLRELGDQITITADKKAGLISVEARDTDPQIAAQMANAHVDALQTLMGKLALTDAKQRRVFFEEQVDKISDKPFRDVRIQELILGSMIRQLETARIDEARDGPLLQQVDVAYPPEKRSRPKRVLLVVVAGVLGLILGTAVGLSRQVMKRIYQDPIRSSQLQLMRNAWARSQRVKSYERHEC